MKYVLGYLIAAVPLYAASQTPGWVMIPLFLVSIWFSGFVMFSDWFNDRTPSQLLPDRLDEIVVDSDSENEDTKSTPLNSPTHKQVPLSKSRGEPGDLWNKNFPVPEGATKEQDGYVRCSTCGRVYWPTFIHQCNERRREIADKQVPLSKSRGEPGNLWNKISQYLRALPKSSGK